MPWEVKQDARYKADIKRNVGSLSALWRSMYKKDEYPPMEFIESVSESLAFQHDLVAHYKGLVEELTRKERKRKRDETVVG